MFALCASACVGVQCSDSPSDQRGRHPGGSPCPRPALDLQGPQRGPALASLTEAFQTVCANVSHTSCSTVSVGAARVEILPFRSLTAGTIHGVSSTHSASSKVRATNASIDKAVHIRPMSQPAPPLIRSSPFQRRNVYPSGWSTCSTSHAAAWTAPQGRRRTHRRRSRGVSRRWS